MSAPIKQNTIPNPYEEYITLCQEYLETCRQFLDNTKPEEACRAELKTLIATLGQAIKLMRNNSRFTPRYLVDCSEICASCARRCERYLSVAYQRAAKACREGVIACQRASLIGN